MVQMLKNLQGTDKILVRFLLFKQPCSGTKAMDETLNLVAAAQDGSREAFSRIVRLYQSRVRAYLSGYIRDRNAVDDLGQETFLTAYRGLTGYRGESTLGVWLIGIAHHLAAMHLREKARRRASTASLLEDSLIRW